VSTQVRIGAIDRSRTCLVNPEEPLHSAWKVFFLLEEVPSGRSWDREFQAAVARRQSGGALRFQHELVREGASSYPYRHPRSRGNPLLRLFRRPSRVAVAVQTVCAPTRDALASALSEAKSLVSEANRAHSGSTTNRRRTQRDYRAALDQLDQAIRHVEGDERVPRAGGPTPRPVRSY
jgi:hypothetical protein